MLRDYLDGDDQARVLTWSDVEGWDELEGSRMCRALQDMPELEVKALDACEGHVLDLGAGAGSHSLCLQERGNRVTALDHSFGCVEAMKRRGVEDAVRANVFTWKGGRFDTVLMMMNGIGLCANLTGLKDFFRRAETWLKPGGSILFDSADLLYLFREDPDGGFMDLSKEYYGEVLYRMKYKEAVTPAFGWLFIDFHTLALHAEQWGWEAELLHQGSFHEYLGRLRRKRA